MYKLLVLVCFMVCIFPLNKATEAEEEYGKEGLCVNEIRSYVGGKVNVHCIPEDDKSILEHLKNVKYHWRGETSRIHAHYNFKPILRILHVNEKSTGALECKVTGEYEGQPEESVFYHHVSTQVMPSFFAAYKNIYRVGKCDHHTLQYARGQLQQLATSTHQCHRTSICTGKPEVKCKNGVVTIETKVNLNPTMTGGPYRFGKKNIPPLLSTGVRKLKQGIGIYLYFRHRLRHYFKRRPRTQVGYGFTCRNGYFTDKVKIMSFAEALKHGTRPLELSMCMPCPTGTVGLEGVCKKCPPRTVGVHIASTRCHFCGGQLPKYYGGKTMAECKSTDKTAPPSEFPESCTAAKMPVIHAQ